MGILFLCVYGMIVSPLLDGDFSLGLSLSNLFFNVLNFGQHKIIQAIPGLEAYKVSPRHRVEEAPSGDNQLFTKMDLVKHTTTNP